MNTLTNNVKQVLAVLILIISFSFVSTAQTAVKLDKAGNYTSIKKETEKPTNTGKYFIDKAGNKYPIFKSSGGKYFITRKSKKSGNEYKQYLEIACNMPITTPGFIYQYEQKNVGAGEWIAYRS